jgi:hypothetical protein
LLGNVTATLAPAEAAYKLLTQAEQQLLSMLQGAHCAHIAVACACKLLLKRFSSPHADATSTALPDMNIMCKSEEYLCVGIVAHTIQLRKRAEYMTLQTSANPQCTYSAAQASPHHHYCCPPVHSVADASSAQQRVEHTYGDCASHLQQQQQRQSELLKRMGLRVCTSQWQSNATCDRLAWGGLVLTL